MAKTAIGSIRRLQRLALRCASCRKKPAAQNQRVLSHTLLFSNRSKKY